MKLTDDGRSFVWTTEDMDNSYDKGFEDGQQARNQ